MGQNAISIKNLSFTYENAEKSAIRNFSLDVNKGDYIAVLGTNGSGKSTLSKLIFGYLPLQEGIIEISSQQSLIGFVQQNPRYQIIADVVKSDTRLGPEFLQLREEEIEKRAVEALENVGLSEKLKEKTQSLSLGQTQKLSLAGILALHPDILILDEAVSMIDSESRESILNTVDELHEKGKTIIHITHDIDEAKRANRIVVLEKGDKIFDGTKDDFFAEKKIAESIFGTLHSDVYKRRDIFLERKALLEKKVVSKDEIALAFENVSFSYTPERRALSDINLAFKSGTITAIMGKSGSGKSTLFELGTSLLKPLTGSVYCKGRTSLALQDAESALFETVAADDVAYGPENIGLKGKELRKRVKESMDIVGLPFTEFKDRAIIALSGGEKRKIALAGILALDADVIFFDEPTSSLDPRSREQFLSLVQKLADGGKTIIFSTHHKEDSLAADRVVVIEKGNIIEDSNPVIFEKDKNQDLQLNLRYKEHAKLLSNLRNTTLGEFEEKNTVIHNMNPLAKMILFFVLFIGTVAIPNTLVIGFFLLLSLIYALCAKFSLKKILVRTVKIVPWIALFALFQMLLFKANDDDVMLWTWKFISITNAKVLLLVDMFLHFEGAMITISVFAYSTEESEIISALKKFCHKNVVVFFMLIMRFVPLLSEELSHIVKTQIIREGIKSTRGLFRKIKAILPVIIPLTVQTVRRSMIAAEALEARGF